MPSVDSSKVYCATPNQEVYALDRATGVRRWSARSTEPTRELGFTFGQFTVVAGPVVILADYSLYAFDRITGAFRWSFGKSPQFMARTPPAVADDMLYAGSSDGFLYALEATSGSVRWGRKLGGPNQLALIVTNPVISKDTLYVGVTETGQLRGGLAAVDARTGEELWYTRFPLDRVSWSSPNGRLAVFTDLVVGPASDGRIFALDRTTGAIRWIGPADPSTDNDGRSATRADSIVVVNSTSGVIRGLSSRDGREIWATKAVRVGSAIGPMPSDGFEVYAPYAGGGTLAVLDARTGQVKWRVDETAGGTFFLHSVALGEKEVYGCGTSGFRALAR